MRAPRRSRRPSRITCRPPSPTASATRASIPTIISPPRFGWSGGEARLTRADAVSVLGSMTALDGLACEKLFTITAPEGKPIAVPVAVEDGSDPYLRLDPAGHRAYYEQHGYVVWRGLVDDARCGEAKAAFVREVKPYSGFLYRQASGNPERHVLTEGGHVLN